MFIWHKSIALALCLATMVTVAKHGDARSHRFHANIDSLMDRKNTSLFGRDMNSYFENKQVKQNLTRKRFEKGSIGIFRGRDVYSHEFPSFINLQFYVSNNLVHQCGGTKIGPHHIITANHCLEEEYPHYVKNIYAFSVSDSGAVITQKIYKINLRCGSDKWDVQKVEYDIAILSTKEEMEGPFATLTTWAAKPADELYVVGYGHLDDHGTEAINVKVLPVRAIECHDPRDLHMSKLCTTNNSPDGYGDTCEGDSGGPVFYSDKFTIMGVTSYGQPSCQMKGMWQVAANVYNLRQHLQDLWDKCV